MEIYQERVQRGFSMLTAADRAKVDLDILEMSDTQTCVWGQVNDGAFWPTADAQADSVGMDRCDWLVEHGFDMFHCAGYGWEDLQNEWVRLLTAERE
jgi:hypothetical protein